MGKVATHFSSDLRILQPLLPRDVLSPRLTQPSEGAWLSPTNPPTLSPGARLASRRTLPSLGGHAKGGLSKGLHSHRLSPLLSQRLWTQPARPTSRSLVLTCSADTAPFPVPLPLLLPARPPFSAIFTAC